MAKQTLVFEQGAELSIQDGQLLIRQEDKDPVLKPIEDISRVIVDNHSVHLTVPLINKLAQNNVCVVFCDEKHMPVTMTMDLESNVKQTLNYNAQMNASLPLKKNIWKQIVECKIKNQSSLLQKLGRGDNLLEKYYNSVKSGDSTNREAAASAVYWKTLLGKRFVRDRFGISPNDMLNYSYAILRSAISRALMNSGLLPMLGIFHHNRFDSFPLSDDVMEPYRPFADERVYELFLQKKRHIDKQVKKSILELFYDRIKPEDLSKTTYSLSTIFCGQGKVIYYPTLS